ncbi:MAG: choice-of-anchor D domain-containing protein, partial [Pirellulaceae bacterium]|nr:choice-of-anchor D domain-containing protein [Pirellulaceae bacterium]
SPAEDTKNLPRLEILEPRLAMTASLSACDNLPLILSHGGACSCPICSGQNLDSLFPADIAQSGTTGSGGTSAASPISALPQLSSNSGARVKLYLDFNGNFEASWGGYSNVTTRVFDRDGDATTFSDSELATIQEIWARVAEDYAPFNIDVTTVDPGAITNGNAVRLAIGGNYSDWFGQAAGGVAYVGGFTNGASNTGYVFEDALGNGNARYVAEATSHEAGHLFGLLHQSTWVNGQLQDEYNSGSGGWAPIMGVGYYANRTTWHNGNTNQGAGVFQDDVAILANGTNNFGLRADDYSNSFTTPTNMSVSGTSVNFAGLIGSRADVDVFRFTTGGGSVNFQMNVAQFGNNLDGAIEIRNSAGTVLSVSDPGDSFGASLSSSLSAGSYFLVVRGNGTFGNSAYGNLGQYTITGSIGSAAGSPEISVLVGGSEVNDNGAINFGSATAGTSVDRVITVRNIGTGDLSVSSLTSSIPAGYTLVSSLTASTLQPGQSTTFTLRLNAASVGSFSGVVTFSTNDSNELGYALYVQGTVTAGSATSPEISVLVGGSEVNDNGTISFGSTQAGTSVDRVITVRNIGTADLSVSSLTSGIPAGYTLVSSLNATTLQPGQSTTFTLRLNAASAGSFSGVVTFSTNDSNELGYALYLQGTVTAATGGGTGGATTQTIDDGGTGNSLAGAWRVGTRGRDGDVHVASRATSDTAVSRWTFTNVAPGQYRVYMSWTGDRLNASNAPVTVVAGAQNLGTTYVNQRNASAGYTAGGTIWSRVTTVTITGTTLQVVLSNNANGNVVADAVRIERVVAGSAARSEVLDIGGDSGSEGSGVYVASLSSHLENPSGQAQQAETHGDVASAQPHDAALQSDLNLDLAPELGLLEDTLDLVREVSRHVRKADTSSGLEGLFAQDSDWLSVLST